MLLTLAMRSLERLVTGNGEESLSTLDVPDFAISQLQLRGMNVASSMLAGWSLEDLDRLRDRGDKAGCPCLVLIEDTPLRLADTDLSVVESATERVQRLAVAGDERLRDIQRA